MGIVCNEEEQCLKIAVAVDKAAEEIGRVKLIFDYAHSLPPRATYSFSIII